MTTIKAIENLLRTRNHLPQPAPEHLAAARDQAAEGGCGVIGMASDTQIAGRHLLQALNQMHNRGNGKGGGIAAVGLVPEQFGVTQQVLDEDYLLCIAYIDPGCRSQVENQFIEPVFEIDHVRRQPQLDNWKKLGLDVKPPEVYQYFVRLRPEQVEAFREEHGLEDLTRRQIEDEIVFQNTYRLHSAYYESAGETRAFVLSHGKNLLVLKMVAYGNDVVRYYQLEDIRAHVWIGHHRYPTKGRVWHPGGAHPFIGLNEALVHNGDFANYASISEYLAQRNIFPHFLTDTEVAVQVFDLLRRTYDYPLEYVIEAIAPTTERDFTMLAPEKQRIYEMLQVTHMHASPDGPWFFLIAQSEDEASAGGTDPKAASPVYRLTCITDTSMLRPQVFALQETGEGGPVIGFAASEKQAIDAALLSLSEADPRFWRRADRYWNARGGSHTDGGAFIFSVARREAAGPHEQGRSAEAASPQSGRQRALRLICTDKFGAELHADLSRLPYRGASADLIPSPPESQTGPNPSEPRQPAGRMRTQQAAKILVEEKRVQANGRAAMLKLAVTRHLEDAELQQVVASLDGEQLFDWVSQRLAAWSYADLAAFLEALSSRALNDSGLGIAIEALTLLIDRRFPSGPLRRSSVLALVEQAFEDLTAGLQDQELNRFAVVTADNRQAKAVDGRQPGPGQEESHSSRPAALIDARAYPPEGPDSLARQLVQLYAAGYRRFMITHCRGHRFIGNGFGPDSDGVRIDVYGSSGDYLASGIDGMEIHVHNSAQDQLAQIMKRGKLVVHGDVGQTFMYGAKGGQAYVLGNAAGRPLINAVGRPRVVINGTALDYLAESFMAGNPHEGGGFVILNGIRLTDDGQIEEMDEPYPGGNLFSLASGGAIYLRDPHGKLSRDQLNGGEFYPFEPRDWDLILPYLQENERLFGIPVRRLLDVDGVSRPPEQVYRKVAPTRLRALQAEEAWVRRD